MTMTGTTAGPVRSWREEMRQDRLARAQIDRDGQAARAELRIAEREALARIRREDDQAWHAARQQARQDRQAARARARQGRAARRADLAAWVDGHVTDLLFVPVIGIPAVLAWTAMADYGYQVYGPPGLGLPAVSEGSMWAFAAATTITRRRHPDRPVWHLRLGTLVFALIGAALNFAHGMAMPRGGPAVGALMAIVSVAGVTAHQLVTAGPRRSRAERASARLARIAARREMAARRAAIRRATAELDEHGSARLVYQPGPAGLARRFGRTRLNPVRDPGRVRTGSGSRTGEDRTDPPADDEAPDRTAPDKDAVVASIADEIRAAIEAGERWQPDYAALMQATGMSKSWCEKAVRRARLSVLDPPPEPGSTSARTVTPRATPGRERTSEARTATRTGEAPGNRMTTAPGSQDARTGEPALAGAP
jgi:hypothetical protein